MAASIFKIHANWRGKFTNGILPLRVPVGNSHIYCKTIFCRSCNFKFAQGKSIFQRPFHHLKYLYNFSWSFARAVSRPKVTRLVWLYVSNLPKRLFACFLNYPFSFHHALCFIFLVAECSIEMFYSSTNNRNEKIKSWNSMLLIAALQLHVVILDPRKFIQTVITNLQLTSRAAFFCEA